MPLIGQSLKTTLYMRLNVLFTQGLLTLLVGLGLQYPLISYGIFYLPFLVCAPQEVRKILFWRSKAVTLESFKKSDVTIQTHCFMI